MNIIADIADQQERWASLRQDIHAHPELAFEEFRTADIVAAELEKMGLEVHRGLAGTGVVATLKGGDGPSIGLRADMDALPMQEHTGVAYRSKYENKAHACGHDGHTTILLAAADYLSRQDKIKGTIHFIFQPAEEVAGGARVMVEDGLFEQFPMDAVFGMHNWPGMDVGGFRVRPGTMLASLDCFDIEVTGVGAHGAMPHQGIDPILVSAAIINAAQSIVSRNVDPQQTAVISITRIKAGDAYNIIPETAAMAGGIRCFDPAVRDQLKQRLQQVVESTAKAHGASAKLTFASEYPPVINSEVETRFATKIASSLVGDDKVLTDVDPILGSEDFSYMLQAKPGCYIMIGNGDGSGTGCMVHNPGYDFNDDAIALGASYWVTLAQAWLAGER